MLLLDRLFRRTKPTGRHRDHAAAPRPAQQAAMRRVYRIEDAETGLMPRPLSDRQARHAAAIAAEVTTALPTVVERDQLVARTTGPLARPYVFQESA